jgi:hypothetical protein
MDTPKDLPSSTAPAEAKTMSAPELGVATGSAPEWRMKMHISGAVMQSLYRDDKLGVQMERTCKRRYGNGPMGYTYSKAKVSYYIDRDPKEYKTEAEMMAAWVKPRKCGLCRGKGFGKTGKGIFDHVVVCPRCQGSGFLPNVQSEPRSQQNNP